MSDEFFASLRARSLILINRPAIARLEFYNFLSSIGIVDREIR